MSEVSTTPCVNKRTVVLVGRTGSGKSSCANGLAGNFDSFKENDGSVTETKFVEVGTVSARRSEKSTMEAKFLSKQL